MGSFTAANLSEAQREFMEDYIQVLHQNVPDFIKKFEGVAPKDKTNYRGRRVPLEVAPNPSLAFGNIDGGDLATPGSTSLNHLLIPYVWMNMGLEQTYGAILNDGKETVSDALRSTVDSTGKTLVKWLNIYASNGDGTTKIGTVSANYSGGTPTVLTLNGATDSIGATQVLVGQRVKVYDPTGTTQRVGTVGTGSIIIASKTKTTLTSDAVNSTNWPSDIVTGDIICPEGTVTSAGMKGVPYIVNNSGTYFGLSRSSVDVTQSVVKSAGGVGVTAALLKFTYNQLYQRMGMSGMTGEGAVELGMNITQDAGYYGLVTATGNTVMWNHSGSDRPQMDVGMKSEEFTWFGAKINKFLDFIGNAIYFLNFRYLNIATLKEAGQMLDMPANDWLQAFNGTTSTWRAARQQYIDVARDNYSAAPHMFAVLSDLSMSGLPMQKS